jgi:hypothetical protein
MDKSGKQFVAQEAPLKNTDNAFIRVSKDGSPAIPATSKDKQNSKPKKEDVGGRKR